MNDVKILLESLNAKVGKEETHLGSTGGHSLHDISNENGQLLIGIASSRKLVEKSTCVFTKNYGRPQMPIPSTR